MTVLIFDTETTGIPAHPDARDSVQPHIIEFAAVLYDRDARAVLEEYSALINPGDDVEIEPIITKITGISREDLVDAPYWADVEGGIRALFEKADVVVAHNLPFDQTMVDLEVARIGSKGWPWPRDKICTTQEHFSEWGKRPKLLELYEFYTGEPLNQTHRALDDVNALLEVYLQSTEAPDLKAFPA